MTGVHPCMGMQGAAGAAAKQPGMHDIRLQAAGRCGTAHTRSVWLLGASAAWEGEHLGGASSWRNGAVEEMEHLTWPEGWLQSLQGLQRWVSSLRPEEPFASASLVALPLPHAPSLPGGAHVAPE